MFRVYFLILFFLLNLFGGVFALSEEGQKSNSDVEQSVKFTPYQAKLRPTLVPQFIHDNSTLYPIIYPDAPRLESNNIIVKPASVSLPLAPDAPSPKKLYSGSRTLKIAKKSDKVMPVDINQYNRLVILVDEDIFTPLETTLWQSLEDILIAKTAPVLSSLSFVYNCFFESDKIHSGEIDFDEWFIYKVPHSHLFLFIPKKGGALDDSGFNIEALEKVKGFEQVVFDDKHFEKKGVDMRQSPLAKKISLLLKYSPEVEFIGRDKQGMSIHRFKHIIHESKVLNRNFGELGDSESTTSKKYCGDPFSFNYKMIEFLLGKEKKGNDKKWNILWIGHGGGNFYNILDINKENDEVALLFEPHMVGGTTKFQAKKILNALNQPQIHTVSLISCYSGGKHREDLTEANQYGNRFNYTLGLLSGSNREVIASFSPENFYDFFNEIEEGKGYYWFQKALFNFIKEINYIGNIPQVLAPGAEEFHVFVPAGELPMSNEDDEDFIKDISRRIGSITQVKLSIKSFSPGSKPLHFDSHDIVVVYPDVIDQPITVAPRVLENYFMQGESEASKEDYINMLKDNFYDLKTNHYGKTFNDVEVDFGLRQEFIAFPAFESMNYINRLHAFRSIELTYPAKKEAHGYYKEGLDTYKEMFINDYNPKVSVKFPGVFTFLTQTFLNISERKSSKAFFIKKLTGYDDSQFVFDGYLNKIDQKSQIERKKIVLEDLFIFTDPEKNKIILCSKIGNSYREFFMVDGGWSQRKLTNEKKKALYDIVKVENPTDEERFSPSFEWRDFKKIDGYNKEEPFLLQLFDLWPQVQEFRGNKINIAPSEKDADKKSSDLFKKEE